MEAFLCLTHEVSGFWFNFLGIQVMLPARDDDSVALVNEIV